MTRVRLFMVNVGYHTRMFPLVTPPIGLMALAAYLRQKFDMEIRLVNQRLDNPPTAEVVRQAKEFGPDVIGLSSFTTSAYLLPGIVRGLREALPDALIALGGPHASAAGYKALEETGADAAVTGEGEIAFEQIIRTWLDNGDLGTVDGLVWRGRDGAIRINPGALPLVEDLDSLPMPAYDLIDLPQYWRRQSIAPVVRRKYASLVTSRGCPYRCMWCHNIFGKRIRVHSAERVIEEIAYLNRTYGVSDFDFLDDNFNFHSKRVVEFCEGLKRRNLRVKLAFPTGVRGDILTRDVVDALADAGMYQCSFALETGSPRLQKYTCKSLNIPRFLKAGGHAVKRRIYTNVFCMLGFPTETEAELQQTIDVACSSPFHTASFYTVTPFPGTPLYDIVKETHPEKLSKVCYDDMDFSGMRINLTDLPDEMLFAYQRKALRRFFLNPRRAIRLIRDYPQSYLLPVYVPIFLHRATKGLFDFGKKTPPDKARASAEEPSRESRDAGCS